MSSPAGTAAPQANITGYNLRNYPRYNPQQMNLFNQIIGSLLGGGGVGTGIDWLSQLAGGEEGAFEQSEAPAYTAFNKSLGEIGSRFAGYGSGSGALGSSAFQQATSGAAANLAENLQAKRLGMQNDALDRLLGLSERTLERQPHGQFLEPKTDIAGGIGDIIGILSSIAGSGSTGIISNLIRKFL